MEDFPGKKKKMAFSFRIGFWEMGEEGKGAACTFGVMDMQVG